MAFLISIAKLLLLWPLGIIGIAICIIFGILSYKF